MCHEVAQRGTKDKMEVNHAVGKRIVELDAIIQIFSLVIGIVDLQQANADGKVSCNDHHNSLT